MTAEPEETVAQPPLPGGVAQPSPAGTVAQPSLPGSLSFQSGTGYLLGKVGAVAKQRWTATLAQAGVSPNQFLVLMALAETGQVCQQFLAGVIGIDPRNIVPILDSVEARGLISRDTDPADRRRRLIGLTPRRPPRGRGALVTGRAVRTRAAGPRPRGRPRVPPPHPAHRPERIPPALDRIPRRTGGAC